MAEDVVIPNLQARQKYVIGRTLALGRRRNDAGKSTFLFKDLSASIDHQGDAAGPFESGAGAELSPGYQQVLGWSRISRIRHRTKTLTALP